MWGWGMDVGLGAASRGVCLVVVSWCVSGGVLRGVCLGVVVCFGEGGRAGSRDALVLWCRIWV